MVLLLQGEEAVGERLNCCWDEQAAAAAGDAGNDLQRPQDKLVHATMSPLFFF